MLSNNAQTPEDFDDLEELMDESTRTVAATEVDDLEDLDQLLEESTAIAKAKKDKAQGRKLTSEQNELLIANHLAAEANLWEAKEVYAHVVKSSCQCGNHFEDFRGWYQYQEQRRGGGRRLIRCDDHDGLPAARYVTEEVTAYCHACGPVGLPTAGIADCDLLEALGEPEETVDCQLAMFNEFGLTPEEMEEAQAEPDDSDSDSDSDELEGELE